MTNAIALLADYQDWLNTIKQRVVSAFRFYCGQSIWQQAVAKFPVTARAGVDVVLAEQFKSKLPALTGERQ